MLHTQLKDIIILICVFAFLFVSGCSDNSQQGGFDISVSSSYLSSAVRDISGNNFKIFSIVPPAMCPGHFDISPSQVSGISGSDILFIFEFQKRMKDSLSGIAGENLRIEAIKSNSGLCVPDTYLAICRQVCSVLGGVYPERKAVFEQKYELLEKRLKDFQQRIKNEIQRAGLDNANIVCSVHQKEFAEWLGLNVVGIFKGRDTETAKSLNSCIKAGLEHKADFVIANKQEGIKLAKIIAGRIGAETAVFSNFPESLKNGGGFETLVQDNVSELIKAEKL